MGAAVLVFLVDCMYSINHEIGIDLGWKGFWNSNSHARHNTGEPPPLSKTPKFNYIVNILAWRDWCFERGVLEQPSWNRGVGLQPQPSVFTQQSWVSQHFCTFTRSGFPSSPLLFGRKHDAHDLSTEAALRKNEWHPGWVSFCIQHFCLKPFVISSIPPRSQTGSTIPAILI